MFRQKTLELWQFLSDAQKKGVPAMLLYVLESNGSSPGRQGFGMAIDAAGNMVGSVGGGIMEHKFIEMAKATLLNNGECPDEVKQQFHDKQAARNQSGMICSGDQTILLHRLRVEDLPAIDSLVTSLQQHKNGTLQLSPMGIQFADELPAMDFFFDNRDDIKWLYREKTGYKNQLSIIGGGHCALAFSKLMSNMDFYIHLYDHRQELNTIAQNHFVHETTVVDDFSQLSNFVHPGPQHYVVVMTVGYRTDDAAIRALLGKKFSYFGVLGSKHKIAKLFSDYLAEGIAWELLEKIHAPVGISIKSETPEEIAVSIAAEIIQVKNRAL